MSYDDEESMPVGISVHDTEAGGTEVRLKIEPPTTDEIADALARRLFADYSASKSIREMAAARFDALICDAVEDAAKEAIADAMGAPRQPTDEFGNPVGAPRTFAQMIGEQVKAWQDQTVDPHTGQPKAKSGYSSDNVITRAQWHVRQVGAHEFEKAAKEAVMQVRADAKAKIDQTIKASVASAIASLAAK